LAPSLPPPSGTGSCQARAPSRRVESILDIASRDSRIKGVIQRIDSPGGGITASSLLLKEIDDLRRGDT
jgi:ClpP class serine protease